MRAELARYAMIFSASFSGSLAVLWLMGLPSARRKAREQQRELLALRAAREQHAIEQREWSEDFGRRMRCARDEQCEDDVLALRACERYAQTGDKAAFAASGEASLRRRAARTARDDLERAVRQEQEERQRTSGTCHGPSSALP